MRWTTWELGIVLCFIAVMTLVPMWLLASTPDEDEVLKTGVGAIFAAAAFSISWIVKRVFQKENGS